jgi:hypothetical protein
MCRSIVITCLAVVIASAFPASAIDPPSIIVRPPIFTIDPCFTADVKLSLSEPSARDVSSGSDYWVSVDTLDLLSGTTKVAQLFSNYRRVTLGGTHYSTMEHTFIAGNITLFGKASNSDAGYAGAVGVITDVLVGRTRQDIKATYLITDFGGNRSICFFVIP